MNSDSVRLQRSFIVPLVWTIFLWLVLLLIRLFDLPYHQLTLQPGKIQGLIGIATAPFLHVEWGHLISNSLPLLLLGGATAYFYPKRALVVFIAGIFIPGIGVWLIGQRPSHHLGVSGVVFALNFFLMLSGIFRRDRQSLTVALSVIILYGGAIWGIFPGQPGVSWEYHLFGALVGAFMAVRYVGDKPPTSPPQEKDEEDNSFPIWDYKQLFPPPEGFQYPDEQT